MGAINGILMGVYAVVFVDSFKFDYAGYYQSPTIPTIHDCLR